MVDINPLGAVGMPTQLSVDQLAGKIIILKQVDQAGTDEIPGYYVSWGSNRTDGFNSDTYSSYNTVVQDRYQSIVTSLRNKVDSWIQPFFETTALVPTTELSGAELDAATARNNAWAINFLSMDSSSIEGGFSIWGNAKSILPRVQERCFDAATPQYWQNFRGMVAMDYYELNHQLIQDMLSVNLLRNN
jgi:hypothetical protein